jgi:hypothetical protein
VDARYSSSVLIVLRERLICAGSAIMVFGKERVAVKCNCQGLVGWAMWYMFGDGLQEQGRR